MIAKITTGAGFHGTLDYLMSRKPEKRQDAQKAKAPEQKQAARQKPAGGQHESAPDYERGQRHRIIGGNMSGRTPRELAGEFEAVRRQRPSISKPVHHVSLSAAPGERLTVEQWRGIVEKYVKGMGFTNSPYVVVQHRDTAIDHVHILTSRVDVRGRVIKDSFEKRRAEEIMREVEREYGLKPVAMSREVERAAPKRGEAETFERTGRLSAKMSLQGRVERALKGGPMAAEFIERLERSGVSVVPYLQGSGRVSGVSFRQGEELMKGSDLGRGFSWGGLLRRGLDYDAERDREAIEGAWKRAYPDRELPRPPMPTTVSQLGTLQKLGELAGQYLLDRANPVKRIEGRIRTVEHVGEQLAEGYRAAREFLKPGGGERLQQAAGVEVYRDELEAVERLNRAAGVEPAPTTAGAEPPSPTSPTGDELTESPSTSASPATAVTGTEAEAAG
jgi:hypothetical protein